MSATQIVGAGAVTGYGWGMDALAAGLRSGTSAGRHQTIEGVDTVALGYKRDKEVDPIRLRPHPYEFVLYYDI